MKKILMIISIFCFSFISCNNEDYKSQNEFELTNIKLEGILDYNTQLTIENLENDEYHDKLEFIINEAFKTIPKGDENTINLKFSFQEDLLFVSLLDTDTGLNNPEGPEDFGGSGMDCDGWKHCETCRSQKCVEDFISSMAKQYECFIIKVDRGTYSAKVYGKPC
jgi:hypothetical protein